MKKKKKILIIGAGALGSGIGGLLAKAGHDVVFLGRKKNMDAISKNGLKITGIFGDYHISKIKTEINIKNLKNPNIIFFLVKSYDTEKIAKKIKHLVQGETMVISLQNGIGNEEILEKIIGKNKILGGLIFIAFELLKPGLVKITANPGKLIFGEMNQKLTKRAKELEKILNHAKIPSQAVNNIKDQLWNKLLFNAMLNPLGALFNVQYGELTKNKYTWKIIQNIIKEIFQISKKEKIKLIKNTPKEYEKILLEKMMPKAKDHLSSMLYDINKKKKTEIDAITGQVIKFGKKHNISTKTNETIYNLIKFKETLNLKQN